MLEWMLMPYRRYADFSGRSRRKEYWMFTLLSVIVMTVVLALMFGGMGGLDENGEPQMGPLGMVGAGLLGIWVLGSIVPSIAVQVRRFHDQDKSGWFVLLGFIPYIGGLIVLVFMCLEGTRGPNRFGEDPKGAGTPDVFA